MMSLPGSSTPKSREGLKKLQESVVGTINGIIRELIAKAGVDISRVSHMTAAGNTIMTHLLLGLDPKYIRESPYTPVANYIPAGAGH